MEHSWVLERSLCVKEPSSLRVWIEPGPLSVGWDEPQGWQKGARPQGCVSCSEAYPLKGGGCQGPPSSEKRHEEVEERPRQAWGFHAGFPPASPGPAAPAGLRPPQPALASGIPTGHIGGRGEAHVGPGRNLHITR